MAKQNEITLLLEHGSAKLGYVTKMIILQTLHTTNEPISTRHCALP